MKQFNLLVFLFMLVTMCSCNDVQEPAKKKIPPSTEGVFKGIETLFNQTDFPDSSHLSLLKELKICSEFQKDTTNYFEPACSPRFFRILPMKDNTKEHNAFLLQIKSKVGGIKLRRTVAFIRERGELVKVNTFIANLIGIRTSKSHYNDLILRFNDNIEGEIVFYNCLFTWDGQRYKFRSVELIEGVTWRQRLKPEFKDSVSNDIYNTLIKNEMIL